MLGDRIKELRIANNMTQKELADYLGVTPKAVSFYELNQREPSGDIVVKLSKKFNVTIDFLYGRTNISQLPGYLGPVIENKKIPIIGSVKCGPDGLAFEYIDGYVTVDDTFYGNIVAFRCKGDSMKGIGINDGDIAIVRQQDDVECGELAIVIVNGDEGTLKRVRKFDGGIILESANPDYPPRVFTGEDLNKIKIIGKVLETRKRF